MSVYFKTYCVDCKKEAPEICDSGMLGQPSLEINNHEDNLWGDTIYSYTFGWLHEGLKAINLIPFQVQAYRLFLYKHLNHNVILLDNDDDFDSEGVEFEKITGSRFSRKGFIKSYYELICPETDDKFRTKSTDHFLPFNPEIISPEKLTIFKTRLIDSPNCLDSINNTYGPLAPEDELGKIIEFFEKHSYFSDPLKKITLKAQLVNTDGSTIDEEELIRSHKQVLEIEKKYTGRIVKKMTQKKVSDSDGTIVNKYIKRLQRNTTAYTIKINPEEEWQAPLLGAVDANNIKVVKALISKGAKLNPKTKGGWTPLYIAVVCQYPEMVKLLIENGANPQIAANDGTKPFDRAIDADSLDIIKQLQNASKQEIITNTSCDCSNKPSFYKVENLDKIYLSEMEIIDHKRKGLQLLQCKKCRQYWQVGELEVLRTHLAIKIANANEWHLFDDKEIQIKYLIESNGGLSDLKCQRMNCTEKRVNGMFFCAEHLFDTMNFNNL